MKKCTYDFLPGTEFALWFLIGDLEYNHLNSESEWDIQLRIDDRIPKDVYIGKCSLSSMKIVVLLAVVVAAEQKREADPHYGYGSPYHLHHVGIAHHPGHATSYVHSHIGKREAEADPHGGYGTRYLYHGLHYPVGIAYHPGHATSYVHSHVGKREAEAEPNPHVRYALPYGYLGYGGYGYPISYGYHGYYPYRHGLLG
ncbi:uncharacterized protein LOC119574070 [Penaeus monodon]|uniref:uncharacterized protein LOC119574070 n=1 Tax=Penaeus monodon TaxID=6687 RepID=UPI0018A7774B|nr:uncharacterized protein LOC119574070 [Penaeus monodon]